MPGQLKEVRNRIRSVQSIQQITKAMKMVSAAKLRRATDAIVQMRPYALKLQEMLGNIVSNSTGDMDMPLAAERPVENVLLVVITSDRGLCGAYNANLIKLAKHTIHEKYEKQFKEGHVTIMPVGKKGYDHFVRHNFQVNRGYRDLFLNLTFEEVQRASAEIMRDFLDKKYDVVEIIYSRFLNAVVQEFQVERFLPIPRVSSANAAPAPGGKTGKLRADFIFEPGQEALVTELMPKILNTQFFKAMLDAHASEHGARMTSMDKATDNADELLRNYRISYNRARQAAITTELTEIVSGAAALEG
jgi:F-type H+-transporting ATPase subunit gamma